MKLAEFEKYIPHATEERLRPMIDTQKSEALTGSGENISEIPGDEAPVTLGHFLLNIKLIHCTENGIQPSSLQ